MNIARYRNELIVVLSLLFLLGAYSYKHTQQKSLELLEKSIASQTSEFEETVSLKRVWGDKRIVQKLAKVKSLIPASQVKWNQKGKKLTASFTDLTPSQVNKVITKLLNIAVRIETIKVKKHGENYNVEIKCKW